MMNLNLFLLSVTVMVNAVSGTTPVNARVELGTAADFVILAEAGITNVVGSHITGDMGVSPIAGTSMTGFGLIMDSSDEFSTSSEVSGNIYAPGYGGDKLIAYNDAAARVTTDVDPDNADHLFLNHGAGEIGGKTLTPGVYTFSTDVTISGGDLTFTGSATDVFIIKTTGSVIQAANKKVILTGDVLAENIFWQVAQKVNVGAGAHMQGTLLVATTVTFITGSTLYGRILSATAVILQKNEITKTPYIPLSARRGLRGLQIA
jgi:hypothetical protein